jgi:hypothetical protein
MFRGLVLPTQLKGYVLKSREGALGYQSFVTVITTRSVEIQRPAERREFGQAEPK